ncbi:MAG: transcriptional repressor [Candidatus Tectomicrobia bacterium]|nr:transcriptional repressor [Candidatus Tectomicrobia bacterium]
MPSDVETFEDYLRSQNLKHSKPRNDILEIFLASRGHFSAQELHEQVREKNSRVGYATVFRTLKLLEDCGLARSMDYDDGTQRYEPNRFEHHHIICLSCNRTVEFLSPEPVSLLRQAKRQHDFTPQSHAVRILSVCTDCEKVAPPSSRHGADSELEIILARDALEMAIANEQQGLFFYNHALDATCNTLTREVFSRLAAEEKERLEVLQAEFDALRHRHFWLDDEPALLRFDCERLESIFPKGREHIRQMVRSAGPAEALQAAIDAERRSYEFFRYYANQVDKPQGQAIFEQFAEEEERHLAVIREAYDELRTRTGSV